MNVEGFCKIVTAEGLHRNATRLEIYIRSLFDRIQFQGKRVIDIGGGVGLYSFFAAINGAKEVVCLEPEADGSHSGMIDKFLQMRTKLGLEENVVFEPNPIQAFQDSGRNRFDLAILHNSINHLDEPACISLHKDKTSRETYRSLLAMIGSLLTDEAQVLICDCSSSNFFAKLGLKNPFAPSIEWHKHQPPELWASLLEEVGFHTPLISWNPYPWFYPLASLTKSRVTSYFVSSHFRMTMSYSRKPESNSPGMDQD